MIKIEKVKIVKVVISCEVLHVAMFDEKRAVWRRRNYLGEDPWSKKDGFLNAIWLKSHFKWGVAVLQ